MRRTASLALIAALVLGCGGGATVTPEPTAAPHDAAYYVRVYGGLEGAYSAILAETDCAALQDQFYTATDNKTTGFQAAIQDRATELRCPTLRFTRP